MINLNCYYFGFVDDISVSYYGPTFLKVDMNTSVENIKKLLIETQSIYQKHAHDINDIIVQIVFYGDTCIKLTNNQTSINDVIPLSRKSESYTIHWYLSKIQSIKYQLIVNDKQSEVIDISDDMKLNEIKTIIGNELNISVNCFKILHMNNIEMNSDKTLAQLGITPTTSYPSDNQMYRQIYCQLNN